MESPEQAEGESEPSGLPESAKRTPKASDVLDLKET